MVEKVHVQGSLHDTGDNGDEVRVVVRLRLGAVDPVRNVERAVGAQQEDVVAREVVHRAVALQHDELRDDCERLEVDGESPKDLERRETLIEEAGGEEARRDGKLVMLEGVLRTVVRFLWRGAVGRRGEGP